MTHPIHVLVINVVYVTKKMNLINVDIKVTTSAKNMDKTVELF